MLENWKTDYCGAAIYSLVDEDGKRYVGQTQNLKRRLYQHYREFNKPKYSMEGRKLLDAINQGKKFKVEVLKFIPWYDATINELRYWEQYYIDLYKRECETYNTAPVPFPDKWCDDYNSISIILKITKKDADIIEYLDKCGNVQGLIKQLIRQEMNK